jgi:hypothetical protein
MPNGLVTVLNPQLYVKRRAFQTEEAHFRPATCAEVNCPDYLNGWRTLLPVNHEHIDFIRHQTGRHFTEGRIGEGLIEFRFPAGQPCFRTSQHRVQNGRPPGLLVQTRDHRVIEQEPERWLGEFNDEVARAETDYRQGSFSS